MTTRQQCLCLHLRGQGQMLRGRPRGMGSVIEWCDQLGAALGQCQEPVWTLMLGLIQQPMDEAESDNTIRPMPH